MVLVADCVSGFLTVTLTAPALRALPARSWHWATWKTVSVHIDYHVEVDGHRYSAAAHAYDIYEHGGDWWLREKLGPAAFIHTSTEMGRASLLKLGLPVMSGKVDRHFSHIVIVGKPEHDSATEAQLEKLHAHLAAHPVKASIRHGRLRFAFHFYNTHDEVAKVLAIVQQFVEVLVRELDAVANGARGGAGEIRPHRAQWDPRRGGVRRRHAVRTAGRLHHRPMRRRGRWQCHRGGAGPALIEMMGYPQTVPSDAPNSSRAQRPPARGSQR